MKKIFASIFFLILPFFISAQDLKLWYNQPATVWTEALPIGNGRLGAMVFGGVAEELIQLNEATLWSGGPVKTNVNPESPSYLPKAREALFKGDFVPVTLNGQHAECKKADIGYLTMIQTEVGKKYVLSAQ